MIGMQKGAKLPIFWKKSKLSRAWMKVFVIVHPDLGNMKVIEFLKEEGREKIPVSISNWDKPIIRLFIFSIHA